ncbi:DUF1294 domain-containing protein [Microbulbifer marinus]|uniref:Uncharacterized membrane protein YsdA, DUF1294 family n=1 Tax=Microbulbifer marinus TaxID=658218 RepID=A0A1H3Z5J3_9GAMM|nr:DUF1294 domain-containing protein [Microbulbifer marinus]SEA19113.1 Uncharacterized membrane protein YsdA, DUF1294 family [Microbulbifer marinus]
MTNDTGPKSRSRKSDKTLSLFVAACFLILVAYFSHDGTIPKAVAYLISAASLLAIVLYAKDKWAAVHGRWRVRESTLHAVALGGGWPGALIAQALFNHKRSKRRFIIAFWITVIINCSLLLWIFTDRNGAQLAAVIAAIKNAVAG